MPSDGQTVGRIERQRDLIARYLDLHTPKTEFGAMLDEIVVLAETANTDEIAELLKERDAHFDKLYSGLPRNARGVAVESDDFHLFCARTAGTLVGCGALVDRISYGELKRFYIRPGFRGRGVGRLLLEAVGREARKRGRKVLMLEVGVLQPEAIRLYRSAGFRERGPFGDHLKDPLSIFMEREI